MGQTEIRRLLIVGAMNVRRWVVRQGSSSNPWLATLMARKTKMVAAAALADKITRITAFPFIHEVYPAAVK
jgi:transposase